MTPDERISRRFAEEHTDFVWRTDEEGLELFTDSLFII